MELVDRLQVSDLTQVKRSANDGESEASANANVSENVNVNLRLPDSEKDEKSQRTCSGYHTRSF